MKKSLIVKSSTRIDAPPTRVWEVLTRPEYIRQWDELPEDFDDYEISAATKIEWPGHAKLTVVTFEPNKQLRYSLEVTGWTQEHVNNIGYSYTISIDEHGHTRLTTEIGDFAILEEEGQKFYDGSVEFESAASQKIKELAEQNHHHKPDHTGAVL